MALLAQYRRFRTTNRTYGTVARLWIDFTMALQAAFGHVWAILGELGRNAFRPADPITPQPGQGRKSNYPLLRPCGFDKHDTLAPESVEDDIRRFVESQGRLRRVQAAVRLYEMVARQQCALHDLEVRRLAMMGERDTLEAIMRTRLDQRGLPGPELKDLR